MHAISWYLVYLDSTSKHGLTLTSLGKVFPAEDGIQSSCKSALLTVYQEPQNNQSDRAILPFTMENKPFSVLMSLNNSETDSDGVEAVLFGQPMKNQDAAAGLFWETSTVLSLLQACHSGSAHSFCSLIPVICDPVHGTRVSEFEWSKLISGMLDVLKGLFS